MSLIPKRCPDCGGYHGCPAKGANLEELQKWIGPGRSELVDAWTYQQRLAALQQEVVEAAKWALTNGWESGMPVMMVRKIEALIKAEREKP